MYLSSQEDKFLLGTSNFYIMFVLLSTYRAYLVTACEKHLPFSKDKTLCPLVAASYSRSGFLCDDYL